MQIFKLHFDFFNLPATEETNKTRIWLERLIKYKIDLKQDIIKSLKSRKKKNRRKRLLKKPIQAKIIKRNRKMQFLITNICLTVAVEENPFCTLIIHRLNDEITIVVHTQYSADKFRGLVYVVSCLQSLTGDG